MSAEVDCEVGQTTSGKVHIALVDGDKRMAIRVDRDQAQRIAGMLMRAAGDDLAARVAALQADAEYRETLELEQAERRG